MARATDLWKLEFFAECLDIWQTQESPSVDLSFIVTEWAIGRADDPYQGVRREPEFDNLSSFATLSWPI